jgi:hypothetical protein
MNCLRKLAFVVVLALLETANAQQSGQVRPSIAPGEFQIAGIVVDVLSMQPISGASVLIASINERDATRPVRTGADGRFLFTGLARGKYSLSANHRGYPPQGYEQHEDYSTAISVGPDLDTTHIVFRLQPGGTIRGRVIDQENDPINQGMVRLFTTRIVNGRLVTQMVRGGQIGDQGLYAFSHLPEGTYYVAVSARPWYSDFAMSRTSLRFLRPESPSPETELPEPLVRALEKESTALDKTYPLTFFGDSTDSSGAAAIHLQPGENFTADITLRAVQSAHLRVPLPEPPAPAQDSSGPIVGVPAGNFSYNPPNIQLFQRVFDGPLINTNMSTRATVTANVFEFSGIAPGHYLLQTSNRNPGVPTPGPEPSGSYMELDISGDMDLPSGASPSATLDGIVQFEGTAAPSSLVVILTNHELARTYGTRLTPKGEFKDKDQLLPGRYEISVGGAEGWYLRSITAAGAKLSGRTLHVNGGENIQLSLKIARGLAEINGTALREGKPFSGAMIVLVPRDAENSAMLFRRDQSDSDGTFTLRDVVPGNYTLLAIRDGWKIPWSESTMLKRYLPAGERLNITPSAKLESTVNVQDK